MCCFLTVLVFFGPRLAILAWWLMDSIRWQLAFSNFIWAFLGFIFLPWTTLMWVAVFPGGIVGFDWLLLGMALLADIGSYTGGGYKNKDRLRIG